MPDLFVPLVLFAAVTTLTPGGATTLATASGTRFGYPRSLPLLLGMTTGLIAIVASTATGLAALIATVPAISLAMKLVGSAYLLWLAVRIARAGPPAAASGETSTPIGFPGGLALVAVNPKAWTMALGAASSFSAIAADPVRVAMLLGGVFGTAGLFSMSLWCLGGTLLARLLHTERHWTILNVALAVLLAVSILSIWL